MCRHFGQSSYGVTVVCREVSEGECSEDTVGGTEVNCVCVCVCGDVLSVVRIQWVVLR